MSNVYRYGALLTSIACALAPCLRAGDAVPGTRYVVAEVLADRVLLSVAGRSEPVELLLGALGGG